MRIKNEGYGDTATDYLEDYQKTSEEQANEQVNDANHPGGAIR